MESQIKNLQNEIDSIVEKAEQDFSENKMQTYKPIIEQLIAKIDSLSEDQSISKKQKGSLQFYKGKILDVLSEYSKQAEESLSKALKLDPLNQECWNTLGHILWKKQDYLGARKMFEGAIDQCGKNKKSLRYLSIVMRCLGQGEERKKNVEKSVQLAKEAVGLDLTDGESWYIVGNAYLSNFFVNMKTIEELQLALKAYIQAEKYQSKQNPDLFYNRATIFQYLEDYNKSIEQYKKAYSLDQTLQTNEAIQMIQDKFNTILDLIDNKGRIKQKRLQNMIKTIPTALKRQSKESAYTIHSLDTLKEGINKGCILTCKITNNVSSKNQVPASFVFSDFQSSFGGLSIYNTSTEIYDQVKENADIFIIDPMIKIVTLTEGETTKQYKCIQVFDITKIFVDSEQVTATFSPSIVVNQTFQNQVVENQQNQAEVKR